LSKEQGQLKKLDKTVGVRGGETGNRVAGASAARVPVSSWAILFALFWTAVAALSLAWNVAQVRELVLDQARIELRANFFKDFAFRDWASRHGGVYVAVTPDNPPDPYVADMPERDVRTPSGRLLTLVNPALMVRQFNELARETYGARSHLSGLDPINPKNHPDPWEARALMRFQQGAEEVTQIDEIDGAPYLRLIRPLKMGKKCLACHVQQGYKEGDLSGGVSVSVPLAPLNAAADGRISSLALGHGGLWLLGMLGIGAAAGQLRRRVAENEQTHHALEEHEARTRAILGASLDAIIAIDSNDVIIDWNARAEQTFGWPRDEALGRSLAETIIPERFRDRHNAGLKRSLDNGPAVLIGRRVELVGLHRDGHEFPIEISIARMSAAGASCFSAYVRDISERKAAVDKINRDYHAQRVLAELLETSMRPDPFEQRLQSALELILSTPWLSLQGSGSIFLADAASGSLHMAARHGLSAAIEQSCETVAIGHCLCGRAAATQEMLFVDCVDERHDTDYPGMLAHGHYCAPILFDGTLLGVLNLYVDAHHRQTPEELQFITAAAHAVAGMIRRHQAEQELRHHAYHDGLTGMPNRILFMDRLEQCLHHCERHPEVHCAVLYLDIDRFKTINDSLGHTLGDQLLLEVAGRVRACMRPADTVARMGGDEFTILLENVAEPVDAMRVSDRLHAALQPPVLLEGREIFVSASIGIAVAPKGCNATDLLRNADTAMYRAKSTGTGQTALFDEHMHLRAVAQLTLESKLRRAVERAELRVHYQPIVEARTGEVLGFEALVRWAHPERGLISPVEFIPLAEETGLINDIGHWVLVEACRQLQAWRRAFPQRPGLYMSVNLSARQFQQPNLVERIDEAIAAAGVEPRYLALEITESVLLHNRETAHRTLLELKARGLHLHVDDFGTGYSSLSYLQNFPFDALKIDRAFVNRLTPGVEEMEMVSTIIAIARNFNMSVIAEGVENDGQVARLIALGCRKVQGFHFSPPLPASAAGLLIRARGADLAG
jgi:diguanylate cyclase (GGDEF)-like protein/PAS domain S-box-containing protein